MKILLPLNLYVLDALYVLDDWKLNNYLLLIKKLNCFVVRFIGWTFYDFYNYDVTYVNDFQIILSPNPRTY